MGFDRKEDFKSDFEEGWRFEEALGIKDSKIEGKNARHRCVTGVHGRAPEAEQAKPAQWTHGHPCACARAAVRQSMAVPTLGLAWFCVFRSLYYVFLHFLGGTPRVLLRSTLGGKLGFSIASRNPTRGRLD